MGILQPMRVAVFSKKLDVACKYLENNEMKCTESNLNKVSSEFWVALLKKRKLKWLAQQNYKDGHP